MSGWAQFGAFVPFDYPISTYLPLLRGLAYVLNYESTNLSRLNFVAYVNRMSSITYGEHKNSSLTFL